MISHLPRVYTSKSSSRSKPREGSSTRICSKDHMSLHPKNVDYSKIKLLKVSKLRKVREEQRKAKKIRGHLFCYLLDRVASIRMDDLANGYVPSYKK